MTRSPECRAARHAPPSGPAAAPRTAKRARTARASPSHVAEPLRPARAAARAGPPMFQGPGASAAAPAAAPAAGAAVQAHAQHAQHASHAVMQGSAPAPAPAPATAVAAAEAPMAAAAGGRTEGGAPTRTVPGRAPPKKFTIRPFVRAPRMPDNFFQVAWSVYLLPAVRAVHAAEAVPHSLEELYRKVEDACMHGHAPELYEALRAVCDAHVAAEVRSVNGLTVDADAFLRLVDDAWHRHCSHMLRIRAIFLKLDRTYLVQGGRADTRSLWDMGLQQFRAHLTAVADVEAKTVNGLLVLVNSERDGEAVDQARLRSLLRMFSAIGTYEESFQAPFIVATSDYFKKEAECLIAESDVPVYMRHAERRLREEADRATHILEVATRKALISLVEQRLVADHVSVILSKGFTAMCEERRREDLERCYVLLGRANQHAKPGEQTAHEKMRLQVIAYVKRVGLALVLDPSKDAEMVQSMLALKAQLDSFVSGSFGGSDLFANAVNYAFESFVNARENKPAELIARHLDGVLRTGNKGYSEEDLENTLDRVLTLFRFIDGKDVFEAFYKKDLSKRLLYDKSASHDLEKVMISKLKAECGSQFTSKLEAMFRDVDASKDLMTSFRQTRSESGSDRGSGRLELNVFVLEASRWPLATHLAELKLPQELVDDQESYKQFYLGKHSGRKLTWQHFDGSCVVKAHFPKGTKHLSLSLYQTVVVMLFNDAEGGLSYQAVATWSGIDEKELKRTLLSLACGKVRVLQKEPKGPTVADTDVFVFNAAFAHKQTRIKVNAIQMKETVEENTGTTEKVFQERSYQIDASLVRIMKTRRTLHHTALIAEVYNQLQFPHKPADIKKRIESLIEREYMERSPENAQQYNYLA